MKAAVALVLFAAAAAALGLAAPAYDWAGGLRFASEMLLYLAIAELWNLLAGIDHAYKVRDGVVPFARED